VFTFSSVLQRTARAKETAASYGDTLTLVTQNPLVTFTSMPKDAGERKPLLPLTIQRTFELLGRHWER